MFIKANLDGRRLGSYDTSLIFSGYTSGMGKICRDGRIVLSFAGSLFIVEIRDSWRRKMAVLRLRIHDYMCNEKLLGWSRCLSTCFPKYFFLVRLLR